MRYTGLAARLVFAERFTAAVVDQPFYAALRMIAARTRITEAPALAAAAVAEPHPAAAALSRAA